MFRSEGSVLCFLLAVLAGFCVVCSSAQFEEEAFVNDQPMPYDALMVRRALRMAPKCSPQGTRCTPTTTRCCGKMGCYSYQGGPCDYPRKSCICRNSQYYIDWDSW